MKIENTSSGKIIGIGEVSVLPGETKEIPEAFTVNFNVPGEPVRLVA